MDFSYAISPREKIVKYCESCEYNGSLFKVRLDKKSGKYLPTPTAQGEFWKVIISDSCSSSPYKLFLKGHVDGPQIADNLVFEITYAYKTGYYELTDTLAITDGNGAFSFQVDNRRSKYVAVMQRDSSFVLYDMAKFK